METAFLTPLRMTQWSSFRLPFRELLDVREDGNYISTLDDCFRTLQHREREVLEPNGILHKIPMDRRDFIGIKGQACRKWFSSLRHVRIVLLIGIIFSVFLFVTFDDFILPQQKFQRPRFPFTISNVSEHGQLVCDCPRTRKFSEENGSTSGPSGSSKTSTCDAFATARGGGQSVVSYTFFGSVLNEYFEGADIVIEHVAKMYPGWVMRMYHNVTLDDLYERGVLCHLWCRYPHLDLCDISHLPPPLLDQSHICPTFWRFFVMGDPLIDRFLIRDMDSIIIQREVDAVDFWKNSGRTWHVMRDFPNHDAPILAGMWGGTNAKLSFTNHLRNELIANGAEPCNRTWDQELLATLAWPIIQDDMVAHDSFHCMKYARSQSWPTQRPDKQFVGDKFPWRGSRFIVPICPKQCRPVNHQRWIFC